MKYIHKSTTDYANIRLENGETEKCEETEKTIKLKKSLLKVQIQKCKLCSKNVWSDGYEVHLKRNHSGRINKCKLCYAKFKRKVHLKVHIEGCHRNEKYLLTSEIDPSKCSFTCELCSLKFITNSVLDVHIKKKHGKGNEQCEYCQKRFKDSTNLKAHIAKVHSKPTL